MADEKIVKTRNTTSKKPTQKELIESQQKQIDDLQNQLSQLIGLLSKQTTASTSDEKVSDDNYIGLSAFESLDEVESKQIDPNKNIKVMSISDGSVYLKSNSDCSGVTYTFEKFGVCRYIPYGKLLDVFGLNESFFRDGVVLVCDKDVVQALQLEDEYKDGSILNKEAIENIMSYEVNEIKNLVSNATPSIQETICRRIISDLRDGKKNYDRNKVDAIGESCKEKIDLMSVAFH